MFGDRMFGPRHFGNRYFGPVAALGGGPGGGGDPPPAWQNRQDGALAGAAAIAMRALIPLVFWL